MSFGAGDQDTRKINVNCLFEMQGDILLKLEGTGC